LIVGYVQGDLSLGRQASNSLLALSLGLDAGYLGTVGVVVAIGTEARSGSWGGRATDLSAAVLAVAGGSDGPVALLLRLTSGLGDFQWDPVQEAGLLTTCWEDLTGFTILTDLY